LDAAPNTEHGTPAARDTAVDISIVIPVFNEEHRILESLATLESFLLAHDIDAEVILVDDGSTDNTRCVISYFANAHPAFRVIGVPHAGKASAVLAGLETARGAIVGFIDADMATPLETWFACREAIEGGAGVAVASREGIGAVRVGEPWYRHAMGRAFNGLVRALLLPGIHDTQCGFKFFSRGAIDQILPRCRLYRDTTTVTVARVTAFDVELLYIARHLGYRIAVIPITWTYGTHSKVNPLTDTLQNLRDVLLVRWYGWRGRYGHGGSPVG
jgi:glycosyltransferase involved in cell wall biosynthesis